MSRWASVQDCLSSQLRRWVSRRTQTRESVRSSLVGGCWNSRRGALNSLAGTGGHAEVGECQARMSFGVLPVWARGGFSKPRPRMPHVIGRSGAIAGLVFGYPLQAPPSPPRTNKILWVSRDASSSLSNLRIRAQRMAGAQTLGRPVARVVNGGPGPSIINLPAAGCWRFVLTWAGRSDSLDLYYRAAR